MKNPEFIYKYRHPKSIDDLLNCRTRFSCRKNFNDPFDSNIEIVTPSPKEIKKLGNALGGTARSEIFRLFDGNRISEFGIDKFSKFTAMLNQLIDSYIFTCFSSDSRSILMWSHYADSHKGFCIEFKNSHIHAEAVTYSQKIPAINLIELIKVEYDFPSNVARNLKDAFNTKLPIWIYEQEFRHQPGDSMQQHRVGKDGLSGINDYDYNFIESVIFGCNMDVAHKHKIINGLPAQIKFKQATKSQSKIEIIPL